MYMSTLGIMSLWFRNLMIKITICFLYLYIYYSPADRAKTLIQALEKRGWHKPLAIQARTLPYFLSAESGATITGMLGQAYNGAGKTGAFTLAGLSRIRLDQRGPQVIVLAPTNPLAYQLYEQIARLAPGVTGMQPVDIPMIDPTTGNVVMGKTTSPRVVHVAAGQNTPVDAEIVVGTETVILRGLKYKTIKNSYIHTVIVDEADEMLQRQRGNNTVEIRKMLNPAAVVLLFSASLNSLDPKSGEWQVRERADRILDLPRQQETTIKIEQPPRLKDMNVIHAVVPWSTRASFRDFTKDDVQKQLEVKCNYVAELINNMEAGTRFLIFVKSNLDANIVGTILQAKNIKAGIVSRPKEQLSREDYINWQNRMVQTISAFKNGKIEVLIGTGQLARGVDIPNLQVVINFNIPLNMASHDKGPDIARFQHQCGRVGRVGQTKSGLGTCIHFLSNREETNAFDITCGALKIEPIVLNSDPQATLQDATIQHVALLKQAEKEKEEALKANAADMGDKEFTSGKMDNRFGTGQEFNRGGGRGGNFGRGRGGRGGNPGGNPNNNF